MWYICTDDGKLVCFYSDESEVWKSGGQRLVYRISEDGINWSKKFYFAAPEDEKLRPGMVVITRLGNGKYLAVYEMVKSKPNGEVYFKISGSLTDWDARNPGARVQSGETSLCATPAVIWTPAGGKYGTVIAAGWRMTKDTAHYGADLFISRDCGKSWKTIDNPIYNEYKERYTRGYSPGFFTGADGTVYYVNSKDAGALYPNKTDLLFTTLTFKD